MLINKQPRPCGNRKAITGALRRARAITRTYSDDDGECQRIVSAMSDLLHLAYAVSVRPEHLVEIASSIYQSERKGHNEHDRNS